ncbi:putative FAD-linked oxidoreductase-like protein 13 [Seiridium unicorne]|uniref:FAD-linked oxidoreductase-like protein 13 n=1 Tax=Seiridium unicorne TaxID=138068 RepID=A0ABR2V7J1_9PEZI
MMNTSGITGLLAALVVTHVYGTLASPQPTCRCTPEDPCWPSEAKWQSLNESVVGKLIQTHPIAESCYGGPAADASTCDYVTSMWTHQDFQTSNPIGRIYPWNISCAPVNYTAGDNPTTCSLGINPRYVVNATTRSDILATLEFAKQHNIRLVTASTGHDLLGRSDGYGSLEVWLRYYRNGINFQQLYTSANQCSLSNWTGSAIEIDGAWQWKDVHPVAQANNVIVVGGGSISPGAIGGWPSGGGHGPATRNYGLGADQILEAEIMLASGEVVLLNHCENVDLFRAIRGGGPGYGVVLKTVVKAYPNVDVVTAQHVAISPLAPTASNGSDVLDAVVVLLQLYADLNDAGYAGYSYWFRTSPTSFMYTHGFWTIGKTEDQARIAFAPVREKFAVFNDTLTISETYTQYADYWSFYWAESGLYDNSAGDTATMSSRLIDRDAVSNSTRVRETIDIMSGTPEEGATNIAMLVSGGQVFEDAADQTSGLNPAWRRCHFLLAVGRPVPRNATHDVRKLVADDVTFVKGAAMKRLAPNTGGYMNEGDRNDPDHITTFYGENYPSHLAAKKKFDHHDLFYCPTCVGSEAFVERPDGPLCRV